MTIKAAHRSPGARRVFTPGPRARSVPLAADRFVRPPRTGSPRCNVDSLVSCDQPGSSGARGTGASMTHTADSAVTESGVARAPRALVGAVSAPDLDDIDSGWEEEDEEENVDSGWGEAAAEVEEPE